MLKSITSQVGFYKGKGGQVEYFAVGKICKAFGRVKFFFAFAIAIVIVMVIHSENRTREYFLTEEVPVVTDGLSFSTRSYKITRENPAQ